jgi:hypothetical protein
MNRQDWHELGLRLLGVYFVIDGLASMGYALRYRMEAVDYMEGIIARNNFLYNFGVWVVPVIYVSGGTLLLLCAQAFSKSLAGDAPESSPIEPLPAFSLWVKLIGLFFALDEITPIGRLAGSLGIWLRASPMYPGSPGATRTIHELAPEMAHYMRMELCVHIIAFAICVVLIVKSREIAARLIRSEQSGQHPAGDAQ